MKISPTESGFFFPEAEGTDIFPEFSPCGKISLAIAVDCAIMWAYYGRNRRNERADGRGAVSSRSF